MTSHAPNIILKYVYREKLMKIDRKSKKSISIEI